MKVKVKIFGLFFLQVTSFIFSRDLETFQNWEYGVGAPKVQEHEKVKIPYLRYLNPFESFILYFG